MNKLNSIADVSNTLNKVESVVLAQAESLMNIEKGKSIKEQIVQLEQQLSKNLKLAISPEGSAIRESIASLNKQLSAVFVKQLSLKRFTRS